MPTPGGPQEDDVPSVRGTLTAGEALERVLGAQITLRNNRRLQTAMRSSRLPAAPTGGIDPLRDIVSVDYRAAQLLNENLNLIAPAR